MDNSINGNTHELCVDRALLELRRGRAIGLTDGPRSILAASVEALRPRVFERLKYVSDRHMLILTGERAKVMGLDANGIEPLSLSLPRQTDLATVKELAGITLLRSQLNAAAFNVQKCSRAAAASLLLAKKARLVPALITVEPLPTPLDDMTCTVRLEALRHHLQQSGRILRRVSEARIPLAGHENCNFILFRDELIDEEHLAITIGDIQPNRTIPVRLHSACLTGDVFESLRCDCGQQLRGAVRQIAAAGGGVVLYLAQEGRGIGLANKLRAYELQNQGLDTLDADRHLGFQTDERNFRAAATMLHELSTTRIQLLTNNPEKMQALEDEGIQVLNRLPLVPPSNPYNERYIRTKLERAGHLSDKIPEDSES